MDITSQRIVTAIMALVMSFTLVGSGMIGFEFASNGDNGEFQIQAEMPRLH